MKIQFSKSAVQSTENAGEMWHSMRAYESVAD